MTTTAEFMNAHAVSVGPTRIVDGGRMLVRGAQRLIGAAMTLAALGLWLAPGASWESDIMLFKLILSVVALLAGVGLMQASVTPRTPQVEIDPIRREVRLMRPNPTGAATLVQRCSFDLLTRAERRGNFLRFWGQDGELMAETMISDRDALNSLLAGLRDAGKIA